MTFPPLQSPVFTERVNFLRDSQYWTAEQHKAFQIQKLRHLVWHVHREVPFYRDFLNKERLTWEDFTEVEHVRRFPLIDKKTIQEDYDRFVRASTRKEDLQRRSTGGSTGSPLTVYSDADFFARDKANTEHYMNVFGLNIFDHRTVRLYGDRIDEELVADGVFWATEAGGRKLVMSCYHVTRETAATYVAKLNDFRPVYLHTRASAVLPLARAILELGLQVTPIRHLFIDGEYVTEGQRQTIERAFQGRLLNIYGHTEACAVGHPCPHSDRLHFMPQVGIVEMLDSQGMEITEAGQRGELVTTGFNNPAFPLIRYRTRDIGVVGEQSCICGRAYRILDGIEGRMQDYVVDRGGNLVPLAPAVFNYNDMDWTGIREFKVRQDTPGVLHLLLQPETGIAGDAERSEALARYVAEKITAIFAGSFTVTAQSVPLIEKTKIGKHRYLDQQLDLSAYW